MTITGASANHNRISGNIYRKFGNHLENSPCEPFTNDMKLRTPAGNYRYPDIMVVCEDQTLDPYFTESPVILVEVISHSTRKTDEQIKRLEYINIPSLEEYVLVEQDFVDITVLRKSEGWQPNHYFLGDEVHFQSIDLRLTVEEIYSRVDNEDMRKFAEARKTD